MSTFVEIDPSEYDPAAFVHFNPLASDFKLANARALIWFSQLAYETHRKSTIDAVSQTWKFISILSFMKLKTSLNGSFETCGLIGERDGAVILAFAGTDPGIWQNLASDAKLLPQDGSDIHDGFRLAAAAAQPEVEHAAQLSRKLQKPLFITGHSLGAALAALAALMAVGQGSPPQAVYTFGMPRVGGERFRTNYDPTLGAQTYRLVHGLDLVARVAPSSTGFRHVGRLLQCEAGAKFNDEKPLSATGSDEPPFREQLRNVFQDGISNILSGNILSPAGPGTFGPLFRFIPPEIRDHLQDSYWKALTPSTNG
jgi:hypothetical protein